MKASELKIGNYVDYNGVVEAIYMGYIVDSNGKIYSKKNLKPLKYRNNDKGYPSVSLNYEGKAFFRRVHRIVAELFIPNPENKPQVNHIDGNRENYNINNLEWVTPSENVIHSVKRGSRKNWTRNNTAENNPNAKLNWDLVNAIRDLYSIKKYSQNKLGRIFLLAQTRISKIVTNQIWYDEKYKPLNKQTS